MVNIELNKIYVVYFLTKKKAAEQKRKLFMTQENGKKTKRY